MLKVSPARKGRFVSLVSKVWASCFTLNIYIYINPTLISTLAAHAVSFFPLCKDHISTNTKILNNTDNKNLLLCKPCFSENKKDLVKKQKLTIGLAPVTLKHFHSRTAQSCHSSQLPSFLSISFCLSPPKSPPLHSEKEWTNALHPCLLPSHQEGCKVYLQSNIWR